MRNLKLKSIYVLLVEKYITTPILWLHRSVANVLPAKKDRSSSQKLSHHTHSSHVSNLDHHAMKPTKPDSELGQHYSEIAGKRNGLDPDQMKRRCRQNRNLFCQNSICRDLKHSPEYPSVNIPSNLENPAVHVAPIVSQFAHESRRRKHPQKDESTATEEIKGGPENEVHFRHVDQEVMATKQMANTTVQAQNVQKDAHVQAETPIKPLTTDATISVNTIPQTVDDLLACVNYIPPIKHKKIGKIYSVEEFEEPLETEIAVEYADVELLAANRRDDQVSLEDDVALKEDQEIQTDDTLELVPDTGEENQEVSTACCTCNLESESKRAVTMEDLYKLFYQPCHHPPICPLCYEQRRNMLNVGRDRSRSVDIGINTDQGEETQKKRHSLFKKKK